MLCELCYVLLLFLLHLMSMHHIVGGVVLRLLGHTHLCGIREQCGDDILFRKTAFCGLFQPITIIPDMVQAVLDTQ